MKKLAIVLFTVMIAACNTTQTKTTQPTQPESPPPQAASQPQETAPKQAAEDNSVYFDLDKSVVKAEYRDTVAKEAEALKKGGSVTVEGNCDERGSAEYNLALGHRRANAVKKLLVSAGVPAKHIKTVSFGKEKPRADCHDESCWKQNRRVDFVSGS